MGEDKAVEYAGKIIQSTYAKAVKVEGAEPEIQKVISRLVRKGNRFFLSEPNGMELSNQVLVSMFKWWDEIN